MTATNSLAGYLDVTEVAGQAVSVEQVERLCHRYHWAARLCDGMDIVEVACGAGQGLGLLVRHGKSVLGADISPQVLAKARSTYGDQLPLQVFPADAMPLPPASVDRVILFEALYYLPDAARFFAEAARVLRPGGVLLIASANKDLYDFVPSPFSTRYLGVVELAGALAAAGFGSTFAGYIDSAKISLRQKAFRPLKFLASRLGIVPRTMRGKAWLKRMVFGEMTVMPDRVDAQAYVYHSPEPIASDRPSRTYKVIYCAATKLAGMVP